MSKDTPEVKAVLDESGAVMLVRTSTSPVAPEVREVFDLAERLAAKMRKCEAVSPAGLRAAAPMMQDAYLVQCRLVDALRIVGFGVERYGVPDERSHVMAGNPAEVMSAMQAVWRVATELQSQGVLLVGGSPTGNPADWRYRSEPPRLSTYINALDCAVAGAMSADATEPAENGTEAAAGDDGEVHDWIGVTAMWTKSEKLQRRFSMDKFRRWLDEPEQVESIPRRRPPTRNGGEHPKRLDVSESAVNQRLHEMITEAFDGLDDYHALVRDDEGRE